MQKIEVYNIKIEGTTSNITIEGTEKKATNYKIIIPKLTEPTLALLDNVKNKIVTEINLTTAELLDIKSVDELKIKFKKRAEEIIKQDFPDIDLRTMQILVTRLLHDMSGIGDIEYLLLDEQLEEIVINSPREPIRVYHKKYGWLTTNIFIESDNKTANYAEIIARRVGKQVTTLEPLLDAHLITGDRANTVMYPIANKGHTLTIRKFARDPWSITDFIKNKTCSAQAFALIWIAIQYEMNILFSGGTATGKTSFLNSILPFMPPNQRILTIEDTRELMPNKELYWTPLVTRLPNPEGKGEVTMLDLLVNALRMRPDRIILGEIRRQREAEVLFEAMHTGHSVYSTLHANTLIETISRLTNPPISVPINLLQAVDLNVVMFRDRRTGIRRVSQIGEIIVSDEKDSPSARTNMIYRWKPIDDKLIPHSASLKLFESISRLTGMTQQEINKELKERENILNYLVKNNIRKISEIGMIMEKYYQNPNDLIKNIKHNNLKEILR